LLHPFIFNKISIIYPKKKKTNDFDPEQEKGDTLP